METEQAKVRVKTMEGDEQKFGEMANQEELGNKHSEKLQFPQKDLSYLCETSFRVTGASTTESNQCHSKPAGENKSCDEGQKGLRTWFANFSSNRGLLKLK